MLLDGDELREHDRIYHFTAGWGTVATIEKQTARILMDSGGILNMRENGWQGGRKVFYWYPPVFILPRKGKEAHQQKALRVMEKLLNLLEEENE